MRRILAGALLSVTVAASAAPPTAEEAIAFVGRAEARLNALIVDEQRAQWVQSNFLTEDTEILASQASERRIAATLELAQEATRFDKLVLPAELERKLRLLRLSLTLATPSDPAKAAELTRLTAGMEGAYGRGKVTLPGGAAPMSLEGASDVLATSRKPEELLAAWKAWHGLFGPRKADFARYVALANEGAKEIGFPDTGAMWRSKYDMPPAEFAKELDRLWERVKPLYRSLHAYVRWKLREAYGPAVVPEKGPIPAHLLGNMWAQSWGNVYPLVGPRDGDPGFDLTAILKAKKVDAKGMVKYGESFFTSLGFAPFPETFWTRSLFTRPQDRDVVCHASAWCVDNVDDIRIKMCIQTTGEEFGVIHHELGHNVYQRAYKEQPPLFRDSANDGFHEAIGDTIALSITPGYLVKLGFLDEEPPASKDVGLLLRMALDKIAFLPFGLLVDQWRWKVFSGEITPADYNRTWWELRRKYQGVAPAEPRGEDTFDAFAKYHVAANVPYSRYFLAHVLQFQFHEALTEAAGQKGPVNRRSIYGSREAGRKLEKMLAMGQSRPWPDALEAVTGTRTIDASAVLRYFEPLQKWLDEQNRGKPVGW